MEEDEGEAGRDEVALRFKVYRQACMSVTKVMEK